MNYNNVLININKYTFFINILLTLHFYFLGPTANLVYEDIIIFGFTTDMYIINIIYIFHLYIFIFCFFWPYCLLCSCSYNNFLT